MENQFLRQVAKAYVNNGDLDSVFVFPNRRSLKFFQKYLGIEYGLIYNKPLFSPKLITINDLYTNLSGLKNSDSVKQLYILYKEYIALKYPNNKKQGEEKEPFDDFVHWGDIIIKDFNDIDKYLVNANQLFTNIKDLKELDNDFSFLTPTQLEAVKSFWTNFLKGGKFSEKKEFFISIWELMYSLYSNFKEKLRSIGEGYEGQIYRDVAENISKYEFPKTLVFIGFNAPNKCERALMSYLKKIGKGDFYWDFYGELLTQKENSASELISEYVKEYPSKYKLEDSTVSPAEQNFEVFAAPSGVAQAFVVEKILEKLYPMAQISNNQSFSTAVILPDEKFLMPVLNSVPQKFESINVTMGYPIAATAFISFMSLLQNLQNDVRQRGGVESFYHKSVIELLSHEYFKKLSAEESEKIKNEIIATNSIYISSESELLKSDSLILNLVFRIVKGSDEIADYQLNILEELDHKLDIWDREFIYQYYLRIQSLKALNIPMESKTYFKLVNQLTMGITIPFKGEPLAGLQIMGTLETRCLDFENVIIISANEGKFPASNVAQSLIPYNLRIGFQLPTYELQDGIAAYHFYRSICRAKNIFMVYDTRSEDLNNGEVSRYVKQLKYHFNIPIKEQSISSQITLVQDQELCIQKDEEVMHMLISRFTGDGKYNLSASAINNYIACPLKFYFENIEKLPDEEEVVESVESNTFGTIFHSVMENIYKQYEGQNSYKRNIAKRT
jgi:Inactivated superfamily I helicase